MSEPTGGGWYSGGQNRPPQRMIPLVPPPAATIANIAPFPFQSNGGFHHFLMMRNLHCQHEQDLSYPNVMHQQYPAILEMGPARSAHNGMMTTAPPRACPMNATHYVAPSTQYPVQYHSSNSFLRYPTEGPVTKRHRGTILPPIELGSLKRIEESGDNEENEEEHGKETHIKMMFVKRPGLGGERRLTIRFENLGELRYPLQTYGSRRSIVPHGLEGSHTLYCQDWWFRVTHERDARSGSTILVFEVTNLGSGLKVLTRETPEQAAVRQSSGRTICNLAMQMAFKERCTELQDKLETEAMEELRRSNVNAIMNKLNKKHHTMGLLFFGLKHAAVQDNLEMSLKTSRADE